jgi:hypothetical protein
MNTQNFIYIQLAAVGQLIALEMNVMTRHVEPQTMCYCEEDIFWPTYIKVFGVHRT